MIITLDTNCLIDLETHENDFESVKQLVDLHNKGDIETKIVGISASERTPAGTYIDNFSKFNNWVDSLGLGEVEILKPMAVFDVTYWDWSIWSGEEMINQESSIFSILFPEKNRSFQKFCEEMGVETEDEEALRKWKNLKCDSLAYWSHVYYEGDIFVTRDRNFHKVTKKPKLLEVGGKDIFTARKLVELIK